MAVALTPAQVLAKARAKAKREALETTLAHQLRALGLTDGMRTQVAFHPTRKWRFDFCWAANMLAMEVDGGTWVGGAHSRGSGQEKDCEKLAAAVILGYRVMRATTNQVKDGTAALWLEAALRPGLASRSPQQAGSEGAAGR